LPSLQTGRLYEAMCAGRRWPLADWRQYLAGHPIVGRLLRGEEDTAAAGWYPLCDYSPEWVPLRWPGAELRFIDAPWSTRAPADAGSAASQLAERHLSRSAEIAALAAAAGCRDHDELWEHAFELKSLAAIEDWRAHFAEVFAWCALSLLIEQLGVGAAPRAVLVVQPSPAAPWLKPVSLLTVSRGNWSSHPLQFTEPKRPKRSSTWTSRIRELLTTRQAPPLAPSSRITEQLLKPLEARLQRAVTLGKPEHCGPDAAALATQLDDATRRPRPPAHRRRLARPGRYVRKSRAPTRRAAQAGPAAGAAARGAGAAGIGGAGSLIRAPGNRPASKRRCGSILMGIAYGSERWMALQIANPCVVAKVEKLAKATGLTKTALVERAVDRLQHEIQQPAADQSRLRSLLAQLDRIEDRADTAEPLEWDELGLPK
jgi:hypothetical protein